jgi:hypothetical protein
MFCLTRYDILNNDSKPVCDCIPNGTLFPTLYTFFWPWSKVLHYVGHMVPFGSLIVKGRSVNKGTGNKVPPNNSCTVTCDQFLDTRLMSQVTTSQKNLFKQTFLAEMPSRTCELSCDLITNFYAI